MSGSDNLELFVGGQKIGRFDAASGIYRRIHLDGSLSGPARPPWGQGTTQAVPPPQSGPAVPARAPVAEVPNEPAENLPPWLPYAVGGGVLLFVVGAGSAMQRPGG